MEEEEEKEVAEKHTKYIFDSIIICMLLQPYQSGEYRQNSQQIIR